VKKIVSIAFIFLLLFNVLGYYGLFFGLHYQNRQELIQQFDTENYSKLETVTIKVPLAVPYANDSQEYQRVDGEFEHQGEFYHMVKQRLSQDTLYIVCVKDQQSKRINQALTDYVKTFADKPVDGKSQTTTLPSFIKEYLVGTYTIKSSSGGWSLNVNSESAPVVFIASFCASIIHPPERA
jgi:hypothetical protein